MRLLSVLVMTVLLVACGGGDGGAADDDPTLRPEAWRSGGDPSASTSTRLPAS